MEIDVILFFLPLILISLIYFIQTIYNFLKEPESLIQETDLSEMIYYYVNFQGRYSDIDSVYNKYIHNLRQKIQEFYNWEKRTKKSLFQKMIIYLDNPSKLMYENTARASIGIVFHDLKIISNDVDKKIKTELKFKISLPVVTVLFMNTLHKGRMPEISNIFKKFCSYFEKNKSDFSDVYHNNNLKSPIVELKDKYNDIFFVSRYTTPPSIYELNMKKQPPLKETND